MMIVWIEAEGRYGVYERGADRLTGVGHRWMAEVLVRRPELLTTWQCEVNYPLYYFPHAWAVAGETSVVH